MSHPDAPADNLSTIFRWEIGEFERRPLGRRVVFIVASVLFAVIGYALYTDSLLMAITFILIGVMGYIHARQEPGTVRCAIVRTGVTVNAEYYPFENIESFWVIEEPGRPILSLKTNALLSPYLHLPVHEGDIDALRVILAESVPEEEHPVSAVDIIERMLHI